MCPVSTSPKGGERPSTKQPGNSGDRVLVNESQISVVGPLIHAVISRFKQRLCTDLQAGRIAERSDITLNKLLDYITKTAHKLYEQSGKNLNKMLTLITKLNYDEGRKFLLTQEHIDFLLDNLSNQEVSFGQVRFRGGSVIEQKSPNYHIVSTGLSFWKRYIHDELLAAAKEIDDQKRAKEFPTEEIETQPERVFALPKERAFMATLSPDLFSNIVSGQQVATKEVLIGPNTLEEGNTTSDVHETFDAQSKIVRDLYELQHVLAKGDFFDVRVFTVPANRKSLLNYKK